MAEEKRHKPTTDERLRALEALAGVGPGSRGYQDPTDEDEPADKAADDKANAADKGGK
jgi:hypothetical protein